MACGPFSLLASNYRNERQMDSQREHHGGAHFESILPLSKDWIYELVN